MSEINRDIEIWLAFSRALFNDLMPRDLLTGLSGMEPSAHVAMVDRQAARVDDALVAMALATGEPEVRQIFNGLEKDTIIVLCSRWCHYHAAWKVSPPQWIPPDEKDLWRAILLSMLSDKGAALTLRERLWPGVSGVPCG